MAIKRAAYRSTSMQRRFCLPTCSAVAGTIGSVQSAISAMQRQLEGTLYGTRCQDHIVSAAASYKCHRLYSKECKGQSSQAQNSLEADIHTGGRRHVTGVTIHWESSSIQNGEIWLAKVQQLLVCRPNEHVVHEQSMVGSCTHHTDLDPGLQQDEQFMT